MRIECSVEKIKKALHHADKVTGKNLTLPILSCILFVTQDKSLTLRATNLNLGIELDVPAKVDMKGVVAVNGNLINSIFSTIQDQGNVVLELIDQTLVIQTKSSSFKIKTYSHEDFPTIPAVEGYSMTVSSKKFIDGVKSVYYSASLSDIKPEIASVYIYGDQNSMIFVATDSFRLAEKRSKFDFKDDFTGILIPHKNISEIIKIIDENTGDIDIRLNRNQISLTSPGLYLTSRAVDGVFPDYKQIIPKEFKTEAVILKQDLLNALKISNIFSDKFNQVSVHVIPKEKQMVITSKNNDIGEHTTKIQGNFTGEEVEVSFNYKYFIDCFQSISSDSLVLKFNQQNKPMIINGSSDTSFMYLVMPMNR